MTNKKLLSFYDDSIQVEYYIDSHRFKKLGEKTYLVGVTIVTGMLDKSGALLKWSENLTRDYLTNCLSTGAVIDEEVINEAVKQYTVKKKEAGDTGSLIHDWIENYVKGNKPEIPEDEKAQYGIMAFLDWVDKNKVEFIMNEKIVYSKRYDYIGILDSIAVVNGIKFLIDWKSSKGIYSNMRYQTSAYMEAYNEMNGDNVKERMILRLGKDDGSFQVEHFKFESHKADLNTFLALLDVKKREKALYKWQKEVNIH